ncbi:PQQ-binding-like beta-propeller repeat protein [Streptomyces sp. V4I23]|uniref:outer membrane protein assembly factor BamB family protein n=1 Tax=Streptomyces sp. V4I23 TaxID=3042282 RepID=UPI0027D9081C|nr:PQQ-binding-like beta-propeller repeat protein [Streptomyces sp. V4I23]
MADDIPQLTVTSQDGGRLWTLRAPAGTLLGPVVAGGAVYVPLTGGRIAALDANSGHLLWCSRQLTDPRSHALARANDTIVLPVQRDFERSAFTALDAACPAPASRSGPCSASPTTPYSSTGAAPCSPRP